MKRLLIAVAAIGALAAPSDLLAQQERTLVRGEFDNGGFGGAVFKGSGVNGQFAGFFGARGGWVIDHVFVLGAGGYWMGGGVSAPVEEGTGSIDLWYAGAEIEFISGWSQVYHITLLTLIGGGSARLGGESDGIWTTEPGLNLEVNVTHYFRLNAGGGYRFVWGVDLPGLDSGDFSQFFGQVTLKFGAF